MSVEVVCRRCGKPFDVDVTAMAGEWWQRCPNCHPDDKADASVSVEPLSDKRMN